jgi:uncharacterized protein (TIGR02996 family)
MLTGEALLQAILDDPEDDTPRLVYADWLEENGEPERAEFIRAECVLAQSSFPDLRTRHLLEYEPKFIRLKDIPDLISDPDLRARYRRDRTWKSVPAEYVLEMIADADPRAQQLRQRTFDLRLQYEHEWFAPIAKLVRWYSTRRGFVHQIHLPVREFQAYAEEIFRLAPVRQVEFSHTLRNLPALADCPYLERVFALSFQQEGTIPAAELRKLFGSPYVENLRELDLYCERLDEKGFRALARSPHLRRLSKLNLRTNYLGDSVGRDLASAKHLTELADLDLGVNHLSDEGAAEMLIRATHFTTLRRLLLDINSVGPATCRALATAPHLAGLEYLSLAGNYPDSENVRHLAEGRGWPRLAFLNLNDLRIGETGVQILASSPAFAQLEVLSLRSNNLGSAAAKALVSSPHLNRLTCLDLRFNKISTYWRKKVRQRFGEGVCQF